MWISLACSGLGLTGMCCPAPDGSMLACCDANGGPRMMQDEWRSLLYVDHAGSTPYCTILCRIVDLV